MNLWHTKNSAIFGPPCMV